MVIKFINIIIFITTLVYLPIFGNGFIIDDHVFIGTYHPTIAEAFGGAVPPGHEGVYRPIRGLIYTVYYNLFGANPFFYHLHSLLVHLLAMVLVYGIVHALSSRPQSRDPAQKDTGFRVKPGMTAFVAALLFGLHPIHTESITYIASGMDVTGIVFLLASFWLYVKNSRHTVIPAQAGIQMLSFFFALLAFFTNEMTITLPLLLLLYELTVGNAPSDPPLKIRGGRGSYARWGELGRKLWPYFVGAGLYLFIRFVILGIGARGVYLAGSPYLTFLTMTKVLVHYLWVQFVPIGLTLNHVISPGIEAFVYRGYRTGAIAGQSILDPEILASITVITFIIVITVIFRKKQPTVAFSAGWFFIGLLPVMGLVPQGSMFNERMLYLPSVGFVLGLSLSLYNIYNRYNRYNRYIWVGIMLILLFYGVRTATRNLDWRDDVTLWKRDVAAAPTENAYAYFALGNAYNDRKDFTKAVEAYTQSVDVNPGFAVGYASLARTYRDMGNIERSNVYYQKAEAAEPGFWSRP